MINIRNFGIIAHIDAGKTTTTERLLYLCGACRYLGEVDDGTTVTDYLYEEKERGITIQSAVAKCQWKETTFHIIDTPGHIDFMNEVETCLQVLDAAVVILCGQSGIQAQTENLLRAKSMKNKPLIFYINKLDKESADFERVFYEIQEHYPVLPLTFPYYKEDKFVGVVDILSEKLFIQENQNQICVDIPDDLREMYEFYHTLMIDTLTGHDEEFLECVLNENFDKQKIISTIRKLTIEQKITPLFAGSSKKNAGVSLLADGIKNYFPSPKDSYDIEKMPDVFCFKYMAHQELGRLRLVKVNKDLTLRIGTNLYSAQSGENIQIKKIYTPFGGFLEEMSEIKEGEIAIIQEEIESKASSALYVDYNEAINAEKFAEFTTYPIIFLRIEPENPEDREKMLSVGKFLLQEDSTLLFFEDSDSGEIILGGMGELHLEIFRDRLNHSYRIKTRAGKPAVIPKSIPSKSIIKTETATFNVQDKEIQSTLSLEIKPIYADDEILNIDKVACNIDGVFPFPQSKEILQSLLLNSDENEFINTNVKVMNFTTSSSLPSVGLYCSIFSVCLLIYCSIFLFRL
ncbi:MAG: GTP-binding protein [Spirochaetota bacterium]|nr:GTP-binding protein [Spirochaetota bacterium]